MSNYNKIIPTLSGNNLLVESIKSKKPLIFTKIALGDGTLRENESIESLTALKRQMCENTIQDVKNKGNGELDITATISNASVTSGFYARELGVFAKVGDTGQERLFGYTNAGAQASYTPAGTSLDEKLITVTFYVGNDVNVKISLNSQLYITQGALDKHNEAMNAHAELMKLFLKLTGGAVTGDVSFINGAWAAFENNGNNGAIRILPNGTMDVGVNSKGAVSNINLCSENRPGWYSPSSGNKQIATVDEVDAAKKSLTETMKNYLLLTGGVVTGDIAISNSWLKVLNNNGAVGGIRLTDNRNMDVGLVDEENGTRVVNLCSTDRPGWYKGAGSAKEFALSEELSPIKNLLGQGAIVAAKLDSNNGFVKFANGFIIQWGFFQNIPSGGTITFPIAFANIAFSAVANDVNSNNVDNQVHSLRDYTRTTMKIFTQSVQDRPTSNTAWGHYIVIGV